MSALDRYLRGLAAFDGPEGVHEQNVVNVALSTLDDPAARCVAAGIVAVVRAVVEDLRARGDEESDVPELVVSAAEDAVAGRVTPDELRAKVMDAIQHRLSNWGRDSVERLAISVSESLDAWVIAGMPRTELARRPILYREHVQILIRDLVYVAFAVAGDAQGKRYWYPYACSSDATGEAQHYWKCRLAPRECLNFDMASMPQYRAIAVGHFLRGVEACLAESP